jgi:hypothetical protein
MKRFTQMESAWSLKIAALVASTLLASVLPTLAQTAQASTPTNGTTEIINIGAGQTVQRSFNATQGNLIMYGLENSAVNKDLLKYTIYDSTGKTVRCWITCILTSNRSREGTFLPPSTGTYFMAFYFDSPSTTGTIKLSIFDVIQNSPQILSGKTEMYFQSSDVVKIFRINATQGKSIVYGVGNSAVGDALLQYTIYDSTGKSVHCLILCLLTSNRSREGTFLPPSTGTYFMAIYFDNPKTLGNVTLSFPESSEPSNVPLPSASPIAPTPKATPASPSPTPTKTTSPKPNATIKPVVKNPATKIPFKVELRYAGGVDTSSGDLSKSANISGNTEWVYLNYHGDLNDKKTKPTGVRFYIKDPTNKVRTLIGAVALTTTKDVTGDEKPTCSLAKGKSVTYDCRVSFNPENNGIAPKSKIFLYAAPYNSAGESSTLHPISLFPIMDTKAFVACLENGVNKTKKELTAVFSGIIIDEAASEITSSLNLPNQFYQQGTEMAISFTFREILSPTEVLKNLKEVASGAAISNLNTLFFNKTTLKIGANVLKAAATISSGAISGVAGAVDIYVAGKNAQYRISDCESNNPN